MVVLNNIAVSVLVHGRELPEYGDPISRASNVALRYIERVPGAWFIVKVTALQLLDSVYEPGLDLPFLAVCLYIDGDIAEYRVLDNVTGSAMFTSVTFDVRGYKIQTWIRFAKDTLCELNSWLERYGLILIAMGNEVYEEKKEEGEGEEEDEEDDDDDEEEEQLGEIAVKVYRMVNLPVSIDTPEQQVITQQAVQTMDQPMLDAILELHKNPFMNLNFGPIYRIAQRPTFRFQSYGTRESPFAIFRFKHVARSRLPTIFVLPTCRLIR